VATNSVVYLNLTHVVVRIFKDSYFLGMHDFCKFGSVDCRIVQNNFIYLLTAVGLTPGGSSRLHIYKQTVHRTTQ
jgi:hypothetical protein